MIALFILIFCLIAFALAAPYIAIVLTMLNHSIRDRVNVATGSNWDSNDVGIFLVLLVFVAIVVAIAIAEERT